MEKARCPICKSEMKIRKDRENQGMDGSSEEWYIYCPVCHIEKWYPADNFYEREFYTREEVIADWIKLTTNNNNID